MKVLHILYSGLGGHGSVFFSMVKADSENTFEYAALFNGIEDIRQEYIDRCIEKKIPFYFIKKKPGKHLSFYVKLIHIIRKVKPGIIFLHGSMAIPAAYAAKLLQNRNSRIIVRETQAMHIKTTSDKLAFKVAMLLASKVVFLSNEYKEEVKKNLGNLYQPQKITVIPNGIDLSVFKPRLEKPGSEMIVLGMQSRLVPIKDHVTLFKALAILKNNKKHKKYHLLIAGDGEYRFHLEKEVIEAGLSNDITFNGMLNENDLPAFLQSLDIYIHASLGETMSTAIMQAMACGLPIIASDVDGINNMITDRKTGILVPVKNAQSLAEEIYNLSEDVNLQQKLSENALQYATDHFSNKRMFDDYKLLFKNI